MKHYLIYIPGLGDARVTGQKLAVSLWRLYGIKAEVFSLKWATGRNFETKLEKLLTRVDELIEQGYEVSLVGASAGGSAAINAFAARPTIHSVVGICGVMNTNVAVNPRYYRQNPAFKGSMEMLEKSLEKLAPEERHRVMSVRPVWDPVVNRRSNIVRGALHKQVWSVGHAFTIGLMISFRVRTIIRFAKKKARQYEPTV